MATSTITVAEIDDAIRKTLTSQSYSAPGGRQQQMADLTALWKIRGDLLNEGSVNSSGSMMSLMTLEDVR